ncbi:sarcosine oxidase subunit gamma [Arhodomonas sp. SL1]|uniref:sarcosine oxidase subunit gamma n=1 Tax=Arhodomonas sp. SL1 TaxID=3425691 RepID=UPI003F882C29
MSEIKRESPLVGQTDAVAGNRAGAADAGVTLFERPFLGHLNLRGDPGSPAFINACRQVLGVAPPTVANTVSEGEDVVVAWLGPDEWLVMTPPDRQGPVGDALREALAGEHYAVTDVTSGQTVIAVDGDHAREVLAKGTPLDVHPRAFGAGACAQTVLAKASVFLRVIRPGEAFEVVVRRSFADYLWQWLRDAAGEYEPAVLAPQPALETNAGAMEEEWRRHAGGGRS